jgi:hypothetical protein
MASSGRKGSLERLVAVNFTAILALFVMVGAQGLFAQTGGANITGVVTDSQGAVVPGATVNATNIATGVVTPATTNGAGAYNIIQIIPGVYTITAAKEGFSTQVQNDYTLVAEQNAGINFTLQPGKVSEKVTVQAGAELVHTETAELGQTINEQSIVELPLNGRNPASLVLLTPGTVDLSPTNASFLQSYTTFPNEVAASVNGGRQGSTYYLLDGVYNIDNYELVAAPFPNPDATQEFSVIGNNFDPRFGFTSGGVVSIVTKSGTNNWHGDLFEFVRNGAFNAKDPFTHLTDEVHRNQFGGSIGGPIIKDKLFVFGNYQGTIQHRFNSSSGVWVPSDAMRAGDFSGVCQHGFTNGLCNDRNPNPANTGNDPNQDFVNDQIWLANVNGNSGNKITVAQALANPQTWYPGNIICQAAGPNCQSWAVTPFNQGTLALTNLLPHTSDALGHLVATGFPSINDYNEETARVDYNINDHNRISGRGFLNFFNQPATSISLLSSDRSWIVNWQNYGATWTWTINPHIVNNLNGAFTRMYDSSSSGLKVNGQGVCFSQFSNVADKTPYSPCSIEDLYAGGGYGPGFGIGQNYNAINRWTWGFSDSLSISKGKHLIAIGADVLRQYWNLNTDWLALPLMEFGGGANGLYTGYGFSDFLLGDEGFFEQGGGQSDALHAWLIQPYVADQIKLKPNLTVSAGVRWEPYLAPVPTSGRIAMYAPGQQSTRYPNAPVGVVYPGDRGIPDAGMPNDYNVFSPRVGFAWQPKVLPNTSLRGAFGLFSTPLMYSAWNPAANNAPFSPTYGFSGGESIGGQTLPIIPFSDPWSVFGPTGNKSPFPPFADPGYAPGPDVTFVTPVDLAYVFDRKFKAGRTESWNLSLEHQFGSSWLARAAYVGSESYHQPFRGETNPGQFICAPVGPNCTQAQYNLNGTRPNSEFTEILLYLSSSTASYNSAQFTLEHRMSHGLQFTANYTYSKTIDEVSSLINTIHNPRCLICNRGNSDQDVPQVFVASFIYETPALAGWSRATKALLGGWEISGIYRAQSGTPIVVFSGVNNSFSLNGRDHADFASGHIAHVNPGSITNYLVASDYLPNAPGTFGSTGRNFVFGPGINSWDLGFDKNFRFREHYRFQFRWEMFNALNRVTLGGPDNYISDGTFGQIFGTNGGFPSRTMQAAAKLYF